MNDLELKKMRLSDDTVLIELGKILDNSNAHKMVAAINTALEEGYKYVVIDMSLLEFLSSAGIGSILGNIESAREGAGDIILCNASPAILHIIDVLDLSDYLTIRSSREEANTICGITS